MSQRIWAHTWPMARFASAKRHPWEFNAIHAARGLPPLMESKTAS